MFNNNNNKNLYIIIFKVEEYMEKCQDYEDIMRQDKSLTMLFMLILGI